MNTSEKLNHIYELYSQKKYSEAFVLVEEILANEPQNIYAKRYESLLRPYLNDKSEVGKIATVKGKVFRCPHCEAAISLSSLTEEQKVKIRHNDYSNLEIKCSYCHTKFFIQKKSPESIIGIKIGDKIEYYDKKKYRAVGCVSYNGTWFEDSYSGSLFYLEWILLGEDNSYLYFSEGYFWDDGIRTYEFTFSKKIIPDFSIEFKNNQLRINGQKKSYKEKNFVKISSVYGENSKVHKINEEVELIDFSNKSKDYTLEIESSGRQSEAGIYINKDVSRSEAYVIFGKQPITSSEEEKPSWLLVANSVGVFWFLVLLGKFLDIQASAPIILVVVIYILPSLLQNFLILLKSKIFNIFVLGPIIAFSVFVISTLHLEKKVLISIKDIDFGDKFKIEFQDPDLKTEELVKTILYDYGGVREVYRMRRGIIFSVKNQDDLNIINRIKNSENIEKSVQKIFSQNIYKLK